MGMKVQVGSNAFGHSVWVGRGPKTTPGHGQRTCLMSIDRVQFSGTSKAQAVSKEGFSKTVLTPRFLEAFSFAAELHGDQVRKGSDTPYLSHLMAVAGIVMEYGGTEDEIIAALLHDSIEDQAHKYGGAESLRQEIRRRFGDDVLEIVNGCTDADVLPKPPWLARKKAYIDHLSTATPSIRRVSAADKLHNARTIMSDYREQGDRVFGLFKGGKEGTMWYYRALVTQFKACEDTPLVRELDHTVTQLEKLVGVIVTLPPAILESIPTKE